MNLNGEKNSDRKCLEMGAEDQNVKFQMCGWKCSAQMLGLLAVLAVVLLACTILALAQAGGHWRNWCSFPIPRH